MLKWRQVVIWPAVFILVVDISTSAHCAVARPSRSITVVNDVAEPDNKSKRSIDVSSRVVARPANNAKLVQPDVSVGIPGFLTRVVQVLELPVSLYAVHQIK